VLDYRERLLGPLSYGDAMKIVSHIAGEERIDDVQISGDGEKWVPAERFLSLTGQELIVTSDLRVPRSSQSAKKFEGNFKTTTPTALLGRVAREKLSGRFYFEHTTFDGTDRVVLHVASGAPTFVYSSDPELQLPRLLLSKGILGESVIPVALHRSLLEAQPLGVLIARDTGIDLGLYRSVFMKERLATVFGWKEAGTYAFVPGTVDDELPFAASTLSVVPEIVYRSIPLAELAAALHPLWPIPVVRSERFVKGVKQMRLSRAQLLVAKSFQPGRTIGDVLNSCAPSEQKMFFTMAYVLLEADLLLRPIG
jgi:hypothetical protein